MKLLITQREPHNAIVLSARVSSLNLSRIIMDFISVKEYAEAHNISERTVRNYCALGKIAGAQLIGKKSLLLEHNTRT